MDLLNLIKQRESIRNYDPGRTVEKNILYNILDAGRLAPSAANLQPWKFLLISSPEMLEKVRLAYPRPWFVQAPHILIVKGLRTLAWQRADGYNSLETDLTIAMDHMILTAESFGLGTCWVANFDDKLLRRILNMQPDEVIFAITPLGYPAKNFVKKGNKLRKSLDETVEFL